MMGARLHVLCLLIFVVVTCIVQQVTSYNILFVSVFGSKSHIFALKPIAEELARRGHNVTMMTSLGERSSDARTSHGGVREVLLHGSAAAMANKKFNFFMGPPTEELLMNELFNTICLIANATYADPFVQDLIFSGHNSSASEPPSKYDVLVVDAIFNELVLPISHHLKIPTVYVSPSTILPHVSWLMNIPSFYSYVPSFDMFVAGQMSLTQKIRSIYTNLGFIYKIVYNLYPKIERTIRKHLPHSPSLVDLGRNVSFVMSNDHVSINPSVPNMPYFVQVGGLHLKPAAQLPKDLEKFMNNSGDAGVIYFSLGSITKGMSMPGDMRDKLMEGFAQLQQKILWKYETPLKGLSSNVKIIEWAPQSDLLAHPKMKLFITHGGGLSIQEAGYHGCPMLGIPLSAEQMSNVANVVNTGFGEYLSWTDFTVDEFVRKTRKLIDHERYKTNAMKVAALLRDQREHPVKTASYWIEYVVRHKGAPHLRSDADKLTFFQYFLLDVVGVVLLSVIAILALVVLVVKRTIKLISTVDIDVRKMKKH